MGWLSKLTTSSSTAKRQDERKRRRALAEAKRLADSTNSQIEKLGQERDKAWEEAKAYLARGQKSSAQRLIQTVRSKDAQIQKLAKLLKEPWILGYAVSIISKGNIRMAAVSDIPGKRNEVHKSLADLRLQIHIFI